MLSDLRQLRVHHPCGFTSCKVGLWFLPAWHPIRARVPSSPSRRSSSISSPLVLRQIQHCALGNLTALLQSFIFRHLRTLSVFVYQLTLALSLSCALFAKNTGGVAYTGRRSQATGRTPLTPLFPVDRQKRAVMGEYRPSYVFHESQLSNHRSLRHAWCHKPAEVGV